MKQYKVGYTQGVFDMFHIGHLNLINQAKKYCDYLIVGINADELVQRYKHKSPVIPEDARSEIVYNIKAVNEVIIVNTLDKVQIFEKHPFNVIFIGDDWKGNSRWEATQVQMSERGVDVVFLPYTRDVSSTILREKKENAICDSK